MSNYVTFLRSATNWSEFANAPKYVEATDLTYAEAKQACADYNATLSDEEKERGTKMEFTTMEDFDFEREAKKAVDSVGESALSPARERIDEMMSGGQIMKLANDAAVRAAKRKQEPRVFFDAADIEENFGKIPNIGTFRPDGWELVEHRMVDKSGFGADDEPALTVEGYKKWLSQYLESPDAVGWAIIEEGQFQVVIGRFVNSKLTNKNKPEVIKGAIQKKLRNATNAPGHGATRNAVPESSLAVGELLGTLNEDGAGDLPTSPTQGTHPENGYIAYYKGKQIEVRAATSFAAQKKAAEIFKAKKSYEVTVVLAEKGAKTEAFQHQHPSIDLKKAHLYQEEPPRCPRCGSEAGAHSEDCELGIHPDDDVPARTRIDKLFGSNKPEWGVMRVNGDIAPPPDHLMTHGMARRWVKAQKNPKDYHTYSSVPKRTGPGEFPQGPGKFPDRNELFY